MARISRRITVTDPTTYTLKFSDFAASLRVIANSDCAGETVRAANIFGSGTAEGVLDENGEVELYIYQAGTYRVTFSHSGFAFSDTVDITLETGYELNFGIIEATAILHAPTEFYGLPVTVTSDSLADPLITSVDANGDASVTVYRIGNYTFQLVYNDRNYSATVAVTGAGEFSVTITIYSGITFADATEDELWECYTKLNYGEITTNDLPWAVGDERKVHVKETSVYAEQDATVVILHVNPSLKLMKVGSVYEWEGMPDRLPGFYVIGFKNCLLEKKQMNSIRSNSLENYPVGWRTSVGTSISIGILDGMIINTSPIYRYMVSASYTSTTSYEKSTNTTKTFSWLSEREVFPENRYTLTASDTQHNPNRIDLWNTDAYQDFQFDYYKVSANRVKTLGDDGEPTAWWLIHPTKNDTETFTAVSANGEITTLYADSYAGVSPYFIIAANNPQRLYGG